ncbi:MULTISPECIES: hypothetical protein [Rhodococcus]|uniref:Uncharacterized protein n=1 Tax=Rhodococcus opacus RKJ300 = JCM 13270 TaxID=1165867 RepID=I0WUG4_RHOOP|nr:MULTISPECIES: hypothetical protein [Rhodococcus]EID80030.1 hypothetical protein W59_10209 [Rhodococcus opacus RKJ300 = JCM 13270]KAF0957263.1 hypothetical protein MLGJGCBP_09093 [Rhodococcus sp. T7]KAF0965589.1 hypothetical protein MLGJGCBP_01241 [Rhodococcus sp. T7]QQZ18352.1 hypothetical protein GO592_39810 [Rhodococcus sp. 21391]
MQTIATPSLPGITAPNRRADPVGRPVQLTSVGIDEVLQPGAVWATTVDSHLERRRHDPALRRRERQLPIHIA